MRKLPDRATLINLHRTLTLSRIGEMYGVTPAAVGHHLYYRTKLRTLRQRAERLAAKVEALGDKIEILEDENELLRLELGLQVRRNRAHQQTLMQASKSRAWAIWAEKQRG